MFVETSADEQPPSVVFPFVLRKDTTYLGLLLYEPIVAALRVIKIVLAVFYSRSEVGWHEEALV